LVPQWKGGWRLHVEERGRWICHDQGGSEVAYRRFKNFKEETKAGDEEK
jgi:hypothetical protein